MIFDNLNSFLESIKSILIYVVLAVVLVLLVILAIRYKNFGKYAFYLICSIVIIVGVTSSVQLADMLNVESLEVGTAIHIEKVENFDSISSYDFGIIEFETEDYYTYKNIKSFESEEFDGTNRNYILLFNDMPCNNVVVKSGSVSGVLLLNFYNTNGNIETTAELNILIEYFDKETKISTSIENVNNSVSYLNTYMELHGVVIEVAERS